MAILLAAAVGMLVVLTLLWFSAKSAITVCIAEVRNGKVVITRGGVAPRVLSDVQDIVRRPKVKGATLRILREKGHARLEARGDFSEEQLQRLRNVIGTIPLAQLTRKQGKRAKG